MPNDRLIPTNGTTSVVTSIIRVNGNEIPRTYETLSLVIVKEMNKIPFAKIILKDGDPSKEDFPASNDELFVPGNEIELLVGYEANEDLLFKGIIIKHGIKIRSDGSSMLKLDCRDKTFKTTLIPNNKYFTEVTDSEAIEEILGEYKIDSDIDSSEVTHPKIVQYELTDWKFILSRAEANGFLCLVDDGLVSIKKPDFEQESVLNVVYGASILEFDAEIDAREQYTSVKTSSWDHTNQELIEVEAVEPKIKEGGNISATDLATVGDN